MLNAIAVVLTVAALVFPSREVSSAVQLMTDAFRLPRARAYPRPSVLECVCLTSSVRRFVCACANVCVRFPSSTLTSLNSWLSLSSHSRGRLFSQLLAAIQCGSITDAAINTRGHGMHSITDIIEMDSIRLDP